MYEFETKTELQNYSIIQFVAWLVWQTSKTLTPFIARGAILIKQTK